MQDSTKSQLAPLIERARKVLQYEQRGNHQDRVVNGGLELFVVRWADEASAFCKKAGLDLKPIYRFTGSWKAIVARILCSVPQVCVRPSPYSMS